MLPIVDSVLVIEDDEDCGFVIGTTFEERYGATSVRVVDSAEKGIAFLEKNTINGRTPLDLVLVDIVLPGIDGWQFTKEFHNLRPLMLPVPKLVGMSCASLPGNKDREKALSLGMDDFIDKAEMFFGFTLFDEMMKMFFLPGFNYSFECSEGEEKGDGSAGGFQPQPA